MAWLEIVFEVFVLVSLLSKAWMWCLVVDIDFVWFVEVWMLIFFIVIDAIVVHIDEGDIEVVDIAVCDIWLFVCAFVCWLDLVVYVG